MSLTLDSNALLDTQVQPSALSSLHPPTVIAIISLNPLRPSGLCCNGLWCSMSLTLHVNSAPCSLSVLQRMRRLGPVVESAMAVVLPRSLRLWRRWRARSRLARKFDFFFFFWRWLSFVCLCECVVDRLDDRLARFFFFFFFLRWLSFFVRMHDQMNA